jgi:membrane-associated protease RseP (regulator of RpoE activity)
MDLLASLALFAVLLIISPLGILIHELGHALTARRFGARVDEIVAAGEGPALAATVGGTRVRVGLGLTRDLRSPEPGGWAFIAADGLTAPQAIAILRAGPLWQAAYGVLVLVVALAAPLGVLATVLIVMAAVSQVWIAAANLKPDGAPHSDGARIAAIRAEVARHAAASVRVR